MVVLFQCTDRTAFAEDSPTTSDELEVVPGEELILEKIPGVSIKLWTEEDLSSERQIVRRRTKRALARTESSAIRRGQTRRGGVKVARLDLERECAKHVRRGYRCAPNVLVSLTESLNDTHYGLLYGLSKIEAESAWQTTTGSSDIVVAVVDTGVNYNHVDLAANIAVNENEVPDNGIDDDSNGYVDDVYGFNAITANGAVLDDNGHGTHVAGTIAAVGNNGAGVAGVAYGSKILAVKALGATGSGSLYDVVEGIDFAVARGADVINLSLSSSADISVMRTAIENARNSGVLIVAAAGNSAKNIDNEPAYPAAYDYSNLITVAATNEDDERAYFSNYGPTRVHVAAPGEDILSTGYQGNYVYYSGTSMAAPHVAGVSALVLSAQPALTASEVKDVLIATVDEVSDLSGMIVSGGRVNAARAIAEALEPGTGRFDSVEVSLRSRRVTAKKNRLNGRAYRALSLEGVRNSSAVLKCNNRTRGTKATATDGSFTFDIRRPAAGRAALRCQVEVNGASSSRVRVRPLTN